MGKRVHGHLLPIPEVLLKVKKLGLQARALVRAGPGEQRCLETRKQKRFCYWRKRQPQGHDQRAYFQYNS